MTLIRVLTAALALALAAPAVAGAAYPAPSKPTPPKPRAGGSATLRVCKQRTCRYHRIQAAVNAARSGDTIKVANGTYNESVRVRGGAKDKIKLIGNRTSPRRVIIDASGKQNSVDVNNSDGVTVNGFTVRDYKANGVLVSNVDGYLLTNLIARGTGVYGLFAFNSKGGTMSNSEAFNHNDAGFYVGQTPPQTRPKRTIIRNVKAHTNVLGFSGSNMRYTTITKSQWFNNGVGIAPNAISTEKYPPPEANVISDNDIFWNNFNYTLGAPFKVKPANEDTFTYPPGTGIILFGSRSTLIENNRIYGNWLGGLGMIQQVVLAGKDDPALRDASVLRDNTIRNNQWGLGGEDLNGRDMLYDGTGERNCFSGNNTLSPNVPANNGTFAACPGPAQNTQDSSAQAEALSWVLDGDKEKYWIRHPHKPKRGITPLEHYTRR